MSRAMSLRIWELGKKASIAGVLVVSLPVLVPSAFVLAFTGALLAVPLGSAALGYVVVKKIIAAHKDYLEWSPVSSEAGQESVREDEESEKDVPDKDPAGASSSATSQDPKAAWKKEENHPEPAVGEISCEEAPEYHSEPGKSSEDYIVVEKPSESKNSVEVQEKMEDDEDGSKIEKAELQCKGDPEFFQCVEVEMAEDDGGAAGARARTHDNDGGRDKENGVKVDDDKDKELCGSKDQGVGLSVILEDTNKRSSPENPEEESGGAKKKIAAAAPDSTEEVHATAVENGGSSVEGQDHSKEEPRSSVDEYASMTEDFPEERNAVSSDESVTSARNAAAAVAAAKPEVPEKEKRARLRKEVAALKKVIGYRDTAGGSLGVQVERLYSFMGVELPSGCSSGSDYGKLLEAVSALKAVVGVK